MSSLDPKLAGSLVDGAGPKWSPKKILGRRLLKFTLWHKFLLRVLDSPFLRAEAVTMWDVRVAVGICRLRYPDSRVRKPWVAPALIWVLCKIAASASRLRRRRKASGPENPYERAVAALRSQFYEHCGDYLQSPTYAIIPSKHSEGSPTVPPGRAPEEIEEIADIIGFTHWPDEKVWNLRVGYANWLRALAVRSQGQSLSFETEEERQLQASLPPEYRRPA